MNKTPSLSTYVIVVVSTLAGLGWMVYLLLNSPGVPVHDELVHAFIARDAWHSVDAALDLWGRAGNTILYMPGARFGLMGARVESVVLALATSLLALLLARRLGARYAVLVPVLLWFQPIFADLSYTCTTEVPFSLVMVAAMCLVASEQLGWAALVMGLLPLIRHEGIALVALLALWAAWRKNWRAVLLAFAPFALYNVAYWAVIGRWPLAFFLAAKPTEFYGAGLWSHFTGPLAQGAGLVVLLLAANGLAGAIGSTRRMLVLGGYLVYFVIHVVIYRFGLFASGGYAVFLLPLAPGLAVAAALGLEVIVAQGETALRARKAAEGWITKARVSFLVACVALTLLFGFEVKPRLLEAEGVLMQAVAGWLQGSALGTGKVYTSHPWLHEFMPTTNRPPFVPSPADVEPGAIVVWDFHYSDRMGMKRDELLGDRRRWEALPMPRFSDPDFQRYAEGRVLVFRRRVP